MATAAVLIMDMVGAMARMKCVTFTLYSRLAVLGGGEGRGEGPGFGGVGVGDIDSTASGQFLNGQNAYCQGSGGCGGVYYGGCANCENGGGGGTSYASGTIRSYSVGVNYGDGRLVVSYTRDPTSSPTSAPTTYDYYVMQGTTPATTSYFPEDQSAENS